MAQVDIAIIGGGIVGLATAFQLTQSLPSRRILVLEKESGVGTQQTGHNSGVLHTGIYYKPGSLKAVNCREGKQAMEAFCLAEGVPFELCGKVIVATCDEEMPALERIYQRGQANGVRCSLIDRERLAELEPHARGVRAIHVPEAGIVNYRQVCQRLATKLQVSGVQIECTARVTSLRRHSDGLTLSTTRGDFSAKLVVNCAGLHSDRVARKTGAKPGAKIVPFMGQYYALKPAAWGLCRNLIYPVPDPRFPFLGVHFTRMIDGSVECGPNAVLALGREAYRARDANLRDLLESLAYPGFRKMARKYWRMGLGELRRALSKRAFVKALQRLVPDIRSADLEPAPPGIRAQAVTPEGELVDDFLILESDRVINVCNAPSPAATASLSIGKFITQRIATHFA